MNERVARARQRAVAVARARLPAPIRRPIARMVRAGRQWQSGGAAIESLRASQAATLATTELSIQELLADLARLENQVADLTARLERIEAQ